METHPADPARAYAHYVLGMAYLGQAKHDFLGRFQRVEAEKLAAGMAHLQQARALSDNANIQEGCDWYLGMAHPLQGEAEAAKARFQQVAARRGRRFTAAQEMLAKIESVTASP